ncbi:MAG: hypothetical protein QM714_13235 [Nocardioides sp.]|uniref:hypothetical protein n=1 Tax=Nocardioides sp. TaxID=35761 RepID=UPI0039E3F856
MATVSPKLDLAILERILGGLEAALRQLGATRIWLEREGDLLAVLAVVAELPVRRGSRVTAPVGAVSPSC